MYFRQETNNYSLTNSEKSSPRNYCRSPTNIYPQKCEFVKGLSSNFGRKLSSFFVIDEELCQMPFFNFDEKQISQNQMPGFSVHIAEKNTCSWKKISQSILTPYLPTNRILLNKILINGKKPEENSTFIPFIKKKSTMQKRTLEKFCLKGRFSFKKTEKLTKIKKKMMDTSFQQVKNQDFFGEFKEDFRRNSCYNILEGEMTIKQAKFYRIFIEKKRIVSNSNRNIHEELVEKKPFLKKEMFLRNSSGINKVKFSLLSILKNKPNEKKLNYFVTKKSGFDTKEKSDFSNQIPQKIKKENLKETIKGYFTEMKTEDFQKISNLKENTKNTSKENSNENSIENLTKNLNEISKERSKSSKESSKKNSNNTSRENSRKNSSENSKRNSKENLEALQTIYANSATLNRNNGTYAEIDRNSEISENKMMLNSKKSTFFKNNEKGILNPRKTMPNLTPNYLEFQKLPSKNSKKNENFLEETKRKKSKEFVSFFEENIGKKSKEFEQIINKINGRKVHELNGKKCSSLWKDQSELEILRHFKEKLVYLDTKKKLPIKKNKKQKKLFFEKNEKTENLYFISHFSHKNDNRINKNSVTVSEQLKRSIEEASKSFVYTSKLPERSTIKSANKIVNELYGFPLKKNLKLPGLKKL